MSALSDELVKGALDASKRAIGEAEARGQKLTEAQKSEVDVAALSAMLDAHPVDQLGRRIHGKPVAVPKGTAVGAFRKIRGRR